MWKCGARREGGVCPWWCMGVSGDCFFPFLIILGPRPCALGGACPSVLFSAARLLPAGSDPGARVLRPAGPGFPASGPLGSGARFGARAPTFAADGRGFVPVRGPGRGGRARKGPEARGAVPDWHVRWDSISNATEGSNSLGLNSKSNSYAHLGSSLEREFEFEFKLKLELLRDPRRALELEV